MFIKKWMPMKAMTVSTETLLNLKHNKEKLIKVLKDRYPDSIDLSDENGKKYVLKKDEN